jgi:hypothetical protein
MRARVEKKKAPAAPVSDSEFEVANASDYVGVFKGERGQLEFAREGAKLFLVRDGKRVQLQKQAPDRFVADDPDLARFPLVFARKGPDGPVVEVSNGGAWYATDAYDGPRQFQTPDAWRSYVGHYRSEDPWIGSLRIVVLKGRLMLDGLTPLELDGDLFRLRDEPANTEWIRFGEVVNGKCMRLKLSGVDLWRVATA